MKLSVVVPVYNSEKYLSRTLDALANQTYRDFEVILIDDGSTDNSAKICKEYSEKYGNFLYYGIENGGVSNARNTGIKYAAGEWIAFCDADDLPDPDMYDKLIKKAEACGADLCICDFFSERDNRAMGFPWKNETFSGKDILNVFIASMIGNLSDNDSEVPFWGSVCRGIYKKELIKKHCVSFPIDLKFAEDLIFSLNYAMNCNSVAVVREAMYFYTYNFESAMNSVSCRYNKGMFESRKRLVRYIEAAVPAVKSGALQRRLKTTERCYYSECVGNAFTSHTKSHTLGDMIREVKAILNDKRTKSAFDSFDAKNPKKRLLYSGMKHRTVCLFLIYYRLRLFRREAKNG